MGGDSNGKAPMQFSKVKARMSKKWDMMIAKHKKDSE